MLAHMADQCDDWAGIPYPLPGIRMVLEPRYPRAKMFERLFRETADPEDLPPFNETTSDELTLDSGKVRVRNRFWSFRWNQEVIIYQLEDGRIGWLKTGRVNQNALLINTLLCADAWGVEQESKALDMLSGLINERKFKHYLLTGMFTEESSRSEIIYIFRRLRPTLALSTRPNKLRGDEVGQTRILCALCLHPIAHYYDSWAGAMVPTDDVIAHLLMMKGDEPMFWRKAAQHPAWLPQAGIG